MAENKAFRAAEKKIAEAVRNGITKLDLSHNELRALPESLGQLTQLRELDLSRNELRSLPEWLGQLTQLQSLNLSSNELLELLESLGNFTQLRELNLSFNELTEMPESMAQLKQLKSLNLTGNELTELPGWLGQLTQLKWLNLSENKLRKVPEWLGRLRQLKSLDLFENKLTEVPESLGQLTQLKWLNLSGNRLTEVPDTLSRLTYLQVLDLSYDHLKEVPEWLGQLTRLQSLDLSENKLIALPESLGQLMQLRLLNLSGNQLTEVPESLGQLNRLRLLDLYDNELVALPKSLGNCERLQCLLLHFNESLGIPPEILGPEYEETNLSELEMHDHVDPKAILDWYFQSRAETRLRLNEAKMMLVGQGGVGKTSLVHYLINNQPCDPEEQPTEGISIDDWHVQGKKDIDGRFERVHLHVWDFGGQEIMHATHQFFLTRRSLYLLVIDARAGEKESNIHYWLKIIRSYGGDSPVLVVVNKCDQNPYDLNETRLVHDYPNIKGFVQTSCSTGQGIAELRREIGKHVRRLQHVFDELPASYFAVKKQLEEESAEKNYIRIEYYREICDQNDVQKRESQDRLIRFLHDLGVVLNFQDPEDPFCQNDPFVLNPKWVTGGVYAIVNDRELKEKRDGLLTHQKLAAVLNALDDYPENRHDFIVRKMMQFELAYQIGNGREVHWLIPELLDPKEPKTLHWKPKESLNFQYSYPVLPAGVICRFIVRMHQHVDRKRSWRSGTVLKIDGNTILVRGDMEKNKTFIAVQGSVSKRKEQLAIVRDAFRYVHSTIPALGPEEEVPLPDKPDVAVPYDHLLKLDELGERTFVPIGANRCYSVMDLLNGVDSNRYRNERRKRMLKERREMGEKHVFVSYCHDNKDAVERLVKDLEKAGESTWWDGDILGGRDWNEAIREAIKNAYAFMVCLSPELTEERYRSGIYPEIRDAITIFRHYGPGHSYIFPVRLEKCDIPPIEIDGSRTLDRIQHIDLFPENIREAGLQKLLDSLAAAPEHP